MIKKISIAVLIINLSLISCSKKVTISNYDGPIDTPGKMGYNSLSQKENYSTIPYTIAHNYFVKNTFKGDHFAKSKIITQVDFDKLFGTAAVMGTNGKPTPIDFAKQYVIAVTEKETDIVTTLIPKSLTKVGKSIVFKYEIKRGSKTTFTMRPFLMIVLDKKYQGKVKVESTEVK